MSIEVRVPTLPESVADATLVGWHKQPGDPVRRDENLVDLETDKVVLEVPAPSDGVLAKVLHADGDTVTGDEVLALLEDADQVQPAASTAAGTEMPKAKPSSVDEPVLTPALRRMLRQLKLDPDKIPATGKNGRLLKSDVIAYLDKRDQEAPPAVSLDTVAWQAEPKVDKTAEPSAPIPAGERPEQRVPMTRLRARVAERLVRAQQNAAILTTFNEVNLQAVMDLRKRYRESFEQRHDIRLGFMSFFVKAAVEALKRFPVVNASIDGQDIIYHGYFDVGIAVGSPRGLVVPILRDCDQQTFAEIEQGIAAFGKKAEDGKLSYEDLSGGTFTISNGGVFGSMLSTPILNPPQSAILGMHTIQQRPVAENGEIVIRPMMYLAVSYDHRIIDGREAVQFLVTIKQELEDPARLLLNI